jgi:hypothetical protein
MKFYYPKFLKVGPKFVGLSIFDLFVLVFGLMISLILNLAPFECLGLIAVFIGVSKIISMRFPRGYFQLYFHHRSSISWRDQLGRLTSLPHGLLNGVLI